MDFIGPLVELVKGLWGLASKPLGYIYNLKDNVDLLRKETEDLKAKSEDVKERVERGEAEGTQRTKQVEKWLGEVHEFVGGVYEILRDAEERDRIKCLSRCLPRNCRSSYRLGKRVDQMLNEARALQTKEGKFDVMTSPLPPPRVLEMPTNKTVGLDSSLNTVWKCLVDKKQVRVIGLYGTGGVGKTTLMKRINKELKRLNHGFDVIIWVVVSKQVNEDRIQDAIRKRLDIKDELWKEWSWDERVHHLWEHLTRKKFVLLIDDLWERLDLPKIGVPLPGPDNESKAVFTTRSEQICKRMGADETFKVQCLMPEEALELFENNVSKSTVHSHPEISELAKHIVEECKGLPLALITVGRAMAGRENPHEWKHALTTLKNNPYKLSGMVDEVYHILEFSYNSLNDSTLQLCFLYCCLFPEDYPIITDELIELWIGEGLLGDSDDVYSMRDKGEYFLGSLKMACLLESGLNSDKEQWVKMHDVIRDMATWIACDRGQRENKLLVIEKDEDMSAGMISKWGEVEKVSLWGEWIRNINRTPPKCSRLETLFVRETTVKLVPRGFFDSMTDRLAVLNLSNNSNIELFPKEVCNLINLRYLNLSHTRINKLPGEIKKLIRLRWLLLENMLMRILISTGAITSLPLNVFSTWGSTLSDDDVFNDMNEEETLEELGCTQHLTDLSIKVGKFSSVLKILQSPNIQRCIRRAHINIGWTSPTSIVISGSCIFSRLEVLCLTKCNNLREIEASNYSCFPSLVEVYVFECGFLDLSWLVHVPKLRKLMVHECHSLKKIIGDGLAASELFSCLESLTLWDLPELTSICDHTLSFPEGVKFHVSDCPVLRKLPLDTNVARGSFSVHAEAHWWANFEWDPTARVTFQLYDNSPAEEMTFGEAIRKARDVPGFGATMGFGASGPSEGT